VAHNSSKITPLPALSARLYRVAIALVTARRWLIVSPIDRAYRRHVSRLSRRAPTRAFLRESTNTATRAFLMSQRGSWLAGWQLIWLATGECEAFEGGYSLLGIGHVDDIA
jgi:hypothetical protein